jgi:cysteine desulfurase
MEDPIYLDYNGTTPIDPQVAEAMRPYLEEHFGNPSSSHVYGRRARHVVEKARSQVAALLGCQPEEVIFTSGGTESNNHVLFGVAAALKEQGKHIVTSRVEHPAILEPCLVLLEQGFDVTFLPVDKYGRVKVSDLEAVLRPDTILVSIMHANNEVGTTQPIAEIAKITRSRKIPFHTDAAQSVGKIPTRVGELGVDFLSAAGHKLYAPKGIGALYIRKGTPIERYIHGAGQEMGKRGGTENVLEISGLGKASELAHERSKQDAQHLRQMRDFLETSLREALPDVVVHGHPEQRLPNTLSVAFPGMVADQFLAELKGVAASAGAACHADTIRISHVLESMQVPAELAYGTIRLTTGRFTTREQIEKAVEEIVTVFHRLRGRSAN